MNTPEKWLFHRELPAQRRGFHRKNGIPPEVTSSKMRNPPEEQDSAWNYQLMVVDVNSVRKDQKCAKNPPNGKNYRISNSKSSTLRMPTLKKLKCQKVSKRKNKSDPTLLRTSYLPNEIKNMALKSCQTISLKI
jgi:hypothetical protein